MEGCLWFAGDWKFSLGPKKGFSETKHTQVSALDLFFSSAILPWVLARAHNSLLSAKKKKLGSSHYLRSTTAGNKRFGQKLRGAMETPINTLMVEGTFDGNIYSVFRAIFFVVGIES